MNPQRLVISITLITSILEVSIILGRTLRSSGGMNIWLTESETNWRLATSWSAFKTGCTTSSSTSPTSPVYTLPNSVPSSSANESDLSGIFAFLSWLSSLSIAWSSPDMAFVTSSDSKAESLQTLLFNSSVPSSDVAPSSSSLSISSIHSVGSCHYLSSVLFIISKEEEQHHNLQEVNWQ